MRTSPDLRTRRADDSSVIGLRLGIVSSGVKGRGQVLPTSLDLFLLLYDHWSPIRDYSDVLVPKVLNTVEGQYKRKLNLREDATLGNVDPVTLTSPVTSLGRDPSPVTTQIT